MAIYLPSRQRIILCPEVTPGTPITTGGIVGPVSNIDNHLMGSVTTEDASLGMGITNFSVTPNSGRYSTLSWNELLRADSLSVFLLFGMLGAGSDTKTGAGDPYTHTGALTAGYPTTYTAFHDTGRANDFAEYPYATAASVGLSWSPAQPPTFAAQMNAVKPSITSSAPTIATKTSANRAKNSVCTYTYQSGTPGTSYPTADVVSGSITLARAVNPVATSGQDSATDCAPAGLVLSGTFELVYRGAGANTAMADWLTWSEQGDATHLNKIVWTIADGHTFEIDWRSMVFSDCQVRDGGDAMHVSVSWTSGNDLGVAETSSTATAPSAIVALNAVSAVMA